MKTFEVTAFTKAGSHTIDNVKAANAREAIRITKSEMLSELGRRIVRIEAKEKTNALR